MTNDDNVIDSRDVIARIAEIQSDMDSLQDDVDLNTGTDSLGLAEAERAMAAFKGSEDYAELLDLQDLASQAGQYSDDWDYGATLIHDSYFVKYAQETAEDCGMVPDNAAWPMNCIDWKEAARQLKQDYTPVEFGAAIYWVR